MACAAYSPCDTKYTPAEGPPSSLVASLEVLTREEELGREVVPRVVGVDVWGVRIVAEFEGVGGCH